MKGNGSGRDMTNLDGVSLAKSTLQRLAASREAINCRRARHPPNGLITRRAWLTSHNGRNEGWWL